MFIIHPLPLKPHGFDMKSKLENKRILVVEDDTLTSRCSEM